MSVIKFKTEWLTQIALLAACGTAEDVADLCTAIQRASQGLPINEMSPLTETLFHPIAESIEEDRALSEIRSKARKTKSDKSATKSDKTATNIDKTSQEEREEEKEKNQKKEIVEKEDITDSVDNTCNNIASVLSPSSVCAEPENSASAPTEPPISTFLLVDGTEFPVTRDIYDRLARAYPAVDTMQQLREIETWCFANPKYRKTKNGAMRFLNNWFSREQDKGLTPKHTVRNKAQPRLTAEEVYNLPAINPWEGV